MTKPELLNRVFVMKYIKDVLHFLFILFVEIFCGLLFAVIYWVVYTLIFGEGGFALSKTNELIYYLVILLPPSVYCWIEYLKLKKDGRKIRARVYQLAGITYLVGGFVSVLLL